MIVALVLANGLLNGAEIAVVGVDKLRLRQLIETRGPRAASVVELRKSPERFFATVQIGITVVGATAGAFSGARFAGDLEPLIERLPWVGSHAESLSLVVVVTVLSFLTLVLGELVPKSLALRNADRYAVLVGPVLQRLSKIIRPIVWFLTACSNAVLRLFGDRTTFAEGRLSSEELRGLVDEATEEGTLSERAGEIASRALEFVDLRVRRVMVPRSRVVALSRAMKEDDVKDLVLEHGYSRLPVYGRDLDDIVGYVLVKDLLAIAWERQLVVLEDIIRPPLFVSEMAEAATTLQQMQEERVHLAIVVDEHGGTAGIVTIEDLLEELVGEITSEIARPEPQSIRPAPDGSTLIRADTEIREVNRELDLELPSGPGWSTIGGLCAALAGRVPRVGDELDAEGTRIRVEAATERTVLEVRIWTTDDAAGRAAF